MSTYWGMTPSPVILEPRTKALQPADAGYGFVKGACAAGARVRAARRSEACLPSEAIDTDQSATVGST